MKSLPIIDVAPKEISVPQFNNQHDFLNTFVFHSATIEWKIVMKKSEIDIIYKKHLKTPATICK